MDCYACIPQPALQKQTNPPTFGGEEAATELSNELRKGRVAQGANNHNSTIKGSRGEGIKPVTPILN